MVCKVSPAVDSPQRGASGDSTAAHTQEDTDYETALHSAGYGKFSVSALCACACAFFTTGVQNCVMSYVLPAAKCELALTTYQAGLVNMAFMCGGVASAFFWGIVGDVFGRRNTLSFTLILDSIITLAQSTVTDYRVLLVARSIDGFLIGGPSTLVFTYLSDLVGVKRRQFYLNVTGMGFVAAWLILPAIAWLIIPFKLNYTSVLPIQSWRLFLAVASLPGFISGIWMWFLPESPRLLCETSRGEKAVKILARIHKSNNGSGEEFKVIKITHDCLIVSKSINSDGNTTKSLFLGVLRDLRVLVSKAYAYKSSLILFVFFANMAAGFGLNLWIPELLLRVQGNECRSNSAAPTENSTIQILQLPRTEHSVVYPTAASLRNASESNILGYGAKGCDSHIDAEVFTSGLIVGACCVLCNALCLALSGDARGVRRAAGACAAACAAACALLAAAGCACIAPSKLAVAAAAALNATSLNGNVLLIRLLLHALPPRLSGLGVCWGAWWGRAGGVASNFAVGVLLDYSCPAPFIAVAALLAVSIVGIMLIKLEPEQKETIEAAEEESPDKSTGLDRYISTHM